MKLQLFITDAEIVTFFESMGYTCKEIEIAKFQQRTHGFGESVMVPVMHVYVKWEFVPAEALMTEYVRMGILHPGASPKANIDQAGRNLTRKMWEGRNKQSQ